MQGYVQVYTGNGKGKTTAAIGLAVRAAGAGLRVLFSQFAKKGERSEHRALARFGDLISLKQWGSGSFIKNAPTEEDARLAEHGFAEISEDVRSGRFDVVVLDEINIAVHYKLIDAGRVVELMRAKPDAVELVLTGRYADPAVLEAADLVTEMNPVRHYFEKGVDARIGIEK
ncbi:MAG: cob(I)yrinic acid a,c-diamide adenosyltransferase [Planctomycetes bacterium]|nr:cob(I)yrinic acid a,c-diamide adenosyltransferase [Planctomycetota bacterium]